MLWLLAAVCIGAGLKFCVASVSKLVEANATRRWPSVQGTITRTWVDSVPPAYKQDYHIVYPWVSYSYEVDGRAYTAERVDFDHGGRYFTPPTELKLDQAERYLAGYPVGATVTVYHSPRVPSLATLQGQAVRGLIYNFGFSLLPVGLGVFIVVMMIVYGVR